MKEIIAAASKKDAEGRRYTEEWIMLCVLMNIRSPGYYEFLRKNHIMPLPCTWTIRSYFSVINTKCGFDEQFSQLLTKHFNTKTAMQRHGVLLLDEINLSCCGLFEKFDLRWINGLWQQWTTEYGYK